MTKVCHQWDSLVCDFSSMRYGIIYIIIYMYRLNGLHHKRPKREEEEKTMPNQWHFFSITSFSYALFSSFVSVCSKHISRSRNVWLSTHAIYHRQVRLSKCTAEFTKIIFRIIDKCGFAECTWFLCTPVAVLFFMRLRMRIRYSCMCLCVPVTFFCWYPIHPIFVITFFWYICACLMPFMLI